MQFSLYRIGDPWADYGLTTLAGFWELHPHLGEFRLEADCLKVALNPGRHNELGQALKEYLKQRINNLILPAVEMKVLGVDFRARTGNGFYSPDFAMRLTPSEKTNVKQKMKTVQDKPQVSLRRNYIGLKNDWSTLAEQLSQTVDNFLDQEITRDALVGNCPNCGRPAPKVRYKTLQNRNPFYNKTQVRQVRGFRTSVDNGEMCATCNFLSVMAAVHPYLPYFTLNNQTHLLLPLVDDLQVLRRVTANLAVRTVDLLAPEVLSYRQVMILEAILEVRLVVPGWCSFRIPYTVNMHFTYPVPPLTTLRGLVAAALGYPADYVQPIENVELAVGLDRSGDLIEGFSKVVKWDRREQNGRPPEMRTLLIRQKLYQPEYRVYLKGEENLIQLIARALNDPAFPLFLGESDDLVEITSTTVYQPEQCLTETLDCCVPLELGQPVETVAQVIHLPVAFIRGKRDNWEACRYQGYYVARQVRLDREVKAYRCGELRVVI